MENIVHNISQVLGITIIHSLWQGLLIYFILQIIFISAPALSAVKRYNLALAAMLSMLFCFAYTLFDEIDAYHWINSKSLNALQLLPHLKITVNQRPLITLQSAYYAISGYLPFVSAIYIAGLIFNFIKLSSQWDQIRQIKLSLIPAEQMQQYVNTFSKKLNIYQHIDLKFSGLIDVPCIIGYFKPIILLPVSIATHLTACEIEAILLHELSHIKRNDYLVNLLQQVITVILFFNPFGQLVNRIINRERENACDDLVVERTRRPLIYAQALLKLEETRNSRLHLALAATGSKNHLLDRIERIMTAKKPVGNTRHLLVAILLLAGGLGSIAWYNPKNEEVKLSKNIAAIHKKLKAINSDKKVQQVFEIKAVRLSAIIDSNKFIQLSDTVKHKHINKVIIIDKNGNKKEFEADSTKGLDSLQEFQSGRVLRTQMETMRKQSEVMRKQFNSPEWRNQMKAMRKQTEKMRMQFNTPQWKAQAELMRKQGDEMKKQFDSGEWKDQTEQIRRQSDEIRKQGDEMRKPFDSSEWKNQAEEMRKEGEEIRKQSEEMRKQFNSPEWKNMMRGPQWDIDSSGRKHTGIHKKTTPAKLKTSNQ